MIEFLQTALAFIITISILVTIHELGHYWVARLCGVHIVRFSVGFGKPLYRQHGARPAPALRPAGDAREDGGPGGPRAADAESLAPTEFALAAIPLGGYVKMLDEREGKVPDHLLHLTFNRKSVWQRIAIAAAGPAASFLLAIFAYWMLFASGVSGVAPLLGELDPDSRAGRAGLRQGQEIIAVDGVATRTWVEVNMRLFDRLGETGDIVITVRDESVYEGAADYSVPVAGWLSAEESPRPARDLGLTPWLPEVPAIIGDLNEDGRARAAGVLPGDEFLQANGVAIENWAHLVRLIQANPETTLTLLARRGPDEIFIDVTPAGIERAGEVIGFIGAAPGPAAFPEEMIRVTRYPVHYAWLPAMQKTLDVTLFTLESVGKMIMGAISPKNLSGPITIAQAASETAQSGLESFIGFLALLSISLGVINLLPIPVLDGGHLLYYFIEAIAGRPVPERIQAWGLQVGVFLIVGIMLLAFYNDLARL